MALSGVLKAVAPRWYHKLFLLLVAVVAASLALETVGVVASAQAPTQDQAIASAAGMKYLAAALAVGLAGIGGGYAVAVAGAAAASAVAENREVAGTVLLFVALGEGIAIYGLLVAILLIFVAA